MGDFREWRPGGDGVPGVVHQMRLVHQDFDGDVWQCPSCGRRIVLGTPPHEACRVVVAGDEHAVHSGTPAGAASDPPGGAAAVEATEGLEAQVVAWRNWLHDGGIETWLRGQGP